MGELKVKWDAVCEEYRSKFNELLNNGISFEWANGETGGGLIINGIVIDMAAIRYTIDNELTSDKFIEWFNYCIEIANYGGKLVDIANYCNGYRPYTEEQLQKIREAYQKAMKAKEEFDKTVKEETKN